MKRSIIYFLFFLCSFTLSVPSSASADTFGSGVNAFEIDFVPVLSEGEHVINRQGDTAPGNPPDGSGSPSGVGAVSYNYRIGKYEISESMIDMANVLGGLGISKDTRGPNKPATNIDWFEAARFVNWLNESTGNMPAYKFVEITIRGGIKVKSFVLWEPGDAGYNPNNLFRNRLAKYVMPSADEWYKAAYYDPLAQIYYDYPTGSNAPPLAVASGTDPNTAVYLQDLAVGPAVIMQAGGLSPYGTMAQGGNVEEWEETDIELLNDNPFNRRYIRGGFWDSTSFALSATAVGDNQPEIGLFNVGFRIASIPEPSSAILAVVLVVLIMGANGRTEQNMPRHIAVHKKYSRK